MSTSAMINLYSLFVPLFSVIAFLFWLGAGFIAWRENDGTKKHFFCYHELTYGGGGMGDAVECSKCGLNTYDGFDSHLWLFRLLGRVRNI